ncbi:MAG: hypothetical protein QOH90_2132 [Actinomycetota bacterium]|jgi:hypothetical protein|nr:hypothetical protein [Actinomycetota bacterium]
MCVDGPVPASRRRLDRLGRTGFAAVPVGKGDAGFFGGQRQYPDGVDRLGGLVDKPDVRSAKIVADQLLDIDMLKELNRGNW